MLKAARLALPALYLVLAFLLVRLTLHVPHDKVLAAGQTVSDPAGATLTVLQQLSQLVLSLDTAMLGAAGFVVLKGRDLVGSWSPLESLLLICVFLAGALSYFGVYSCQMSILEMVAVGSINPVEAGLLWSLKMQYLGLIGGCLLLGLVFSLMLGRLLARN